MAAAQGQEQQQRLDLAALLSACVFLARRAGRIIREVHAQGNLGAHNKKLDGDTRAAQAMEPQEVLTIADTRAQDAMVTSLRAMFPGIRIVGEEDDSDPGPASAREAATPPGDVPRLPGRLHVPAGLAESLTLADTCLWIDPLDGTIEFVRGNLHNVAVLIGIAVHDRPVAGIMHQPFVGGDDGTVTYGAVGVGVFGDREPAFGEAPGEGAELVVGMEPKHAEDPRIIAGVRRMGEAARNVSQGCGQNLLKLLRCEASVFVQAPGASRWDTCAGEALLMAVGGKVSDLEGRPYTYTQGEASYVNAGGLIAARTAELHARAAAAFAEEEEGGPDAKRART